MEKFGSRLKKDSSTRDKKQTNLHENGLLEIQRHIKHIVHASKCTDVNCKQPGCHKMKRTVQHAMLCNQKANGGCPICKQLIALCCYHAKHCQEEKCPVPYCVNIRYKLRQQQLQQRLQQAQILKRHIAAMQNSRLSSAVLQSRPENSNSSTQPSARAQPHSLSCSPPPVTDIIYSSTPPVDAIQVAQHEQDAAARQIVPYLISTNNEKASVQQQQYQVLSILKANPQLMAAFLEQHSNNFSSIENVD